MANITSAINIQVDSQTKKEATNILNDLGLSMSMAINLFLRQVIKTDGLPFEVKNHKPSREMRKALKEAADMIQNPDRYKEYRDVDELIKDILDED